MRLGLCYCPQFCTGVSIHAPWEGCDTLIFKDLQNEYTFQFTHPGKGATPLTEADVVLDDVSIHAPWEGCDGRISKRQALPVVSIHAPWEGCDIEETQGLNSLPVRFQFTHPGKGATDHHNVISCGLIRFNSRTLGRVRHPPPYFPSQCSSFNSRTLGRVRLALMASRSSKTLFQFTHPGKGATKNYALCLRRKVFQFTHPGKGATFPLRW